MTTRTQRWGVVMAAIAILLLSSVATGSALSGLTLSTRFPGITVKPGEDLSLRRPYGIWSARSGRRAGSGCNGANSLFS